jgi:hypothetical protein
MIQDFPSHIKRKVKEFYLYKKKIKKYSELGGFFFFFFAGQAPSTGGGTLPSTAVTWREADLHYLDHSSTDNVSMVEIMECLACLLKFVFPRNSTGKIEDTAFCQSNQLGKILPCPCSIGANDLNLFHEINRVKVRCWYT